VCPFSPSESFAFPKPPSGDWGKHGGHGLSAPNENNWPNRSTPSSPVADLGRTLTPKQYHAVDNLAAAANIYPIANTASDNVEGHHSILNPFVNPLLIATSSPNPAAEFAEFEVIRRPFVPTLADELSVEPGDSVRVEKIFDDGWAYVEKLASATAGLIPTDCMRDAGEELPAFLAAKRVSSYHPEAAGDMGNVI